MDFTELTADKTTLNSIRGWSNWDVAPAVSILSEAEALIYSQLRVSQMEDLDEGTIAEGDTSLEMPADFIGAKSFRRIGETAGPIRVLDRQHFEERLPLDTDGTFQASIPDECAIYGEPATAHFNFAADQDIDYRLLYFARPAALSLSNPTNWLTRSYPFLVRACCLYMSFLYKKEMSTAQVWQTAAMGLLRACNGEGDLAEQINQLEFFTRQ